MKKGIDVSVFQGVIDWAKVKTAGVQFAMIRGGYGRSGKDERFENNYNGCKKYKIPCGVYHYSYADTVERAKQEAEFVISYLKGKQFEYPVAFDIEDKSIMGLTKSQLTEITKTFCKTVEKAGYYVVIYSSKSFLQNKLDMEKLSAYDVWVAQWNNKCTYKGKYGMWQYTDKHSVSGINGNVDGDFALKDYPSIIKKAGLNGYKKNSSTKPAEVKLYKGQKITLKNKAVYVSSTAKTPRTKKSGTFYVYDGKKINGRYRITKSSAFCGKKPESLFVTGWIEV